MALLKSLELTLRNFCCCGKNWIKCNADYQWKKKKNKNRIPVSQQRILGDILWRFGMENCKPISSPLNPGEKLTIKRMKYKRIPISQIHTKYYQYIQFNTNYERQHWTATKRVLKNLRGTQNLLIKLRKAGWISWCWLRSLYWR